MIPLSSEAIVTFVLFQNLMQIHLRQELDRYEVNTKKAIQERKFNTEDCKRTDEAGLNKSMLRWEQILRSGSYMSVIVVALWLNELNRCGNTGLVANFLSIAHDKAAIANNKEKAKATTKAEAGTAENVKRRWNPDFIANTYLCGHSKLMLPRQVFIDICEIVDFFPRESTVESVIGLFRALGYVEVNNENIPNVFDVHIGRKFLNLVHDLLDEARLGLPAK